MTLGSGNPFLTILTPFWLLFLDSSTVLECWQILRWYCTGFKSFWRDSAWRMELMRALVEGIACGVFVIQKNSWWWQIFNQGNGSYQWIFQASPEFADTFWDYQALLGDHLLRPLGERGVLADVQVPRQDRSGQCLLHYPQHLCSFWLLPIGLCLS